MNETKTGYRRSPDRLKLLWQLLRKRGIDFAPQQISPSEFATGQIKKESEPDSGKQSCQEDPQSSTKDKV
jgi:hypothetical protein